MDFIPLLPANDPVGRSYRTPLAVFTLGRELREHAQRDGSTTFLEVNKPQPVVLFEVVKGWLTGSTVELGEVHRLQKYGQSMDLFQQRGAPRRTLPGAS